MTTNKFIGFLLAAVLLPSVAWAQTAATTNLLGTITDANGALVAGATVKLTGKATGSERTAVSNSDGQYIFTAIEPGLYDVGVTATGFKSVVVNGIKVDVSRAATVDVKLEAGGAEAVVEVTASAGAAELQTTDATLGNAIEADRIKRLPNQNRTATALLALQPGATTTGEITGARNDQSTFMIDGIDVSDNNLGQAFRTVVPVPTESVEEFRVSVANPNATFGRSSGAQVILQTKRGTNRFHGSAYEYHQNAALNANSWTNNRNSIRKGKLIDNRFGFSVGGPVIKDRTFFFFHYEGRRFPGTNTVTRTVPTETLKQGVLRFRDAAGAIQTISTQDIRGLDPRGLGVNPVMLEYLRLYPAGNTSGGDGLNTTGYIFSVPTSTRNNYFVTRLDHQISSKWSFDGRFTYDANYALAATQVDIVNRQALANNYILPRATSVGAVGVLRPNLTSESRFGWVIDRNGGDRLDPFGLVNGLNIGIDVAQLNEPIDVGTQNTRKQFNTNENYQVIENLSWVRGNHTVLGGFNIRFLRHFQSRNDKLVNALTVPLGQIGQAANFSIPASQRPAFIPAGDVSRYNQLYSVLLGIIDNTSLLGVRDGNLQPLPAGTPLIVNSNLRTYEYYAQDTWRIRPSLTVTYGLMYEYQTPPVEDEGKQTIAIYAGSGEVVDPLDYLARKKTAAEAGQIFNPDLAFAPVRTLGRNTAFDTDYSNVSPRVAAAWNPSFDSGLLGKVIGSGRTVVRGGYSLLYDRSNTVQTVTIPTLGIGYANVFQLRGPRNAAGAPFRVGVDGPLPVPAVTPATAPVIPAKGFSETFSFSVDPNVQVPHNHTVDLTVQRELSNSMILEVGYVGRMARNLYQSVNLNSIPFFFKDATSGQVFAEAFDAVAGQLRGGTAPNAVTPQPWFENQLGAGATRLLTTNLAGRFIDGNLSTLWQNVIDLQLRPNAPYNNIQALDLFFRTSLGRSNYHGMVVTLRKRYSAGLTFDLNYTLSKSLDQVGNIQNAAAELTTSYFPDVDYGRSFFDARHVFNGNWVYDLPFGKGRYFGAENSTLNKVIGGWYVAGIFQARSGLPLTVFQNGVGDEFGGTQVFGSGTGAIPTRRIESQGVNSGVAGSGGIGTAGDPTVRPNPTSPFGTGLNIFGDPEAVFKSFRPIQLTTDRRSGRGIISGLSTWNLNLSLAKKTAITEDVSFTLQFDFFNVFNHVIFTNPALNLTNRANFGVITTQANTPRAIQIGARVDF